MGEKKRFLDRVLRFMGIEEEAAVSYEDAADEVGVSSPQSGDHGQPHRQRRTAQLVDPSGASDNSQGRVVVLKPQHFDDVQSIADHLLNNEPVVLNIELLETDLSRRIMDFLGGTVYALSGHIQPLGGHLFLLAPSNVEIDVKAALKLGGTQEEHLL